MPHSLEILTQLSVGRLGQPRCILDQELQLLRQAPPNDGVVLAETHCLGLAGEQFLINEIGKQPSQLGRVRRPEPLVDEGFPEPFDLAFADAYRCDVVLLAGFRSAIHRR